MLLKGAFVASAITAVMAFSTVAAVKPALLPASTPVHAGKSDGSISVRPISLGNPTTAATLATRLPTLPTDPLFRPMVYDREFKIGRGETLAQLLRRAGIETNEANAALSALFKHVNARKLKAGEIVTATFRTRPGDVESGDFLALAVNLDKTDFVLAKRKADGTFDARKMEHAFVRELARAKSTINQSLYVAGVNAGLPLPVLVDLIRLYSWDVDFQRDIRKGDGFEVMYERFNNEEGDYSHTGTILFAAMTLSGKHYTLYRHTTVDGTVDYFNDRGQSAKKALMRTPINGARLSSGFGKRRHPILGYTKVHKGADFAAPKGTPIYAAGNGTVDYAGWKGAYGKYVRIRHNSEYSTAYAHMSGIRTKRGRRVTQGQVIGYVGTTGRSTGAHLHYEILKNSRQVNPLKVRMPSGIKLKGTELARFQTTRTKTDKIYASIEHDPEVAEAK